jgi:outer membrane protein assembly factor BamA
MVQVRKQWHVLRGLNQILRHRLNTFASPFFVALQNPLKYSMAALFACLLCLMSLPSFADEAIDKSGGERISQDVRIEGNRFFDSEELLSEIKPRGDGSRSVDLLERDIDKILTLYEENGFPYCQISPSHFRISERGRLCLSFLVEEGPRVRIREIRLEGLETTKEKVILRELGSGLLGFFSQSRVDAGLRKVERLSYIEEIEQAQLLAGTNPEEAILKICLVESKNNAFSGMLGYAPAAGGRKGGFFGRMELVFDNIFGTGRTIRWNWFKKDAYSSRFLFLYREPWLFGLPPSLELEFSQTDYDSTYLQLSLLARLMFRPTEKISWGVQGGWEKVLPGAAGETYLPNSRKYRTGLIFCVDLLDRPNNPRRGLHYTTEISYAQKRNYPTPSFAPEKQKVSLTEVSLDLNHFLPTLKRQAFFVGLHFKGLSTDEKVIPISDQFKLGGISSIRGYREEEFFGTRIAWVNLEYRFLLDRSSRFFLFTDYGYFGRKALSGRDKTLGKISGEKLGYGFGLRIDSRAGLLGIDYGLGEGDSFSQGKIHFGITNRF